MARIFSNAQFNSQTFSFDGATAAAATNTTVGSAAAGYRFGLNTYDNTMTTTYNGGASRLVSYSDGLVRPTSGPSEGIVTAGVIDVFVKQNLVSTTWKNAFTMSHMDGSAVAFDAALRSVNTADDRAFLASMLTGNDLITLSKYNDNAYGGTGNDTIRSGLGNDYLVGDAGNDRVDGGYGNDTLYGDDNNDVVIGGRGNDFVAGGDGNDTVTGSGGFDTISGGSGADVFLFGTTDGRDTVTFFSQGVDKMQVSRMTASTVWTEMQDGENAVVKVGNVEIVLLNTTIGQITAADFIFA